MKTVAFSSMLRWITGLVMLCLMLACSDETRVTLHEAHVYKGATDMHEGDGLTRQNRLRQRALRAFSDR